MSRLSITQAVHGRKTVATGRKPAYRKTSVATSFKKKLTGQCSNYGC